MTRLRRCTALTLVTLLRMSAIDDGWGLRLRFSEPTMVQANGIAGVPGRSPDRIVIGLTNTTVASGARGMVVGAGAGFRARVQQLDATSAQIVIELDQPLAFRVSAKGPETTIRLEPDLDAGAVVTPPTIPRVVVPPVR